MSTKEIIQEIKKLPFNERLLVIDQALRTLKSSSESQLENAAEALLADYKEDKDLTAFNVLDFEEFYDAR